MASDTGDDIEAYANGRIGTTLRGKYRIDAVIGFGGMAVVYKATHRNQAEFAVKMLHPELSIRDDVRVRFLREGYAANSVKHPGVVLVVDDDVAEDGAAFIVMELLDGVGCETLWERCGGQMSVAVAASIAHQLLDVLSSAHAKGIIHRDLKPANMFVTRDGRVKVLDFGIARVRDIAASNATATGMLLGTPAFMGPEQALAKSAEIDAQTDVWAVGATLFTLLSGALVHEAENGQQILIKAATQRARSLGDALAACPKEIIAVVDRALAFEKSLRWPDAASMRDALAKACEIATGAAPSPSALLRAVAGSSDGALPPADESSRAALAATVSAEPTMTTLPVRGARAPAGGSGRAAPSRGVTAPLPALAINEGASAKAITAPTVSARHLMGMSTATPVASERDPIAITNRRSRRTVAAAASILTLVIASTGVGYVKSRASGSTMMLTRTSPDPSPAASDVAFAQPTASITETAMPSAPAAQGASEGHIAILVDTSVARDAAPHNQNPASKTGGLTAPAPAPLKAGAKPDCTTPFTVDSKGNRQPKVGCEQSGTATIATPPPPASARCRTVVDHVDDRGEKVFKKQCD